jgi:rhodanese-related sulfurtransferase
MSAERSSTIGQQRASNFALQAKSREEFVHLLTSELPERPGYFALDAELNRSGPTPLADLAVPGPMSASEVHTLATGPSQGVGPVVLDTRPPGQFGGAHIPGAIHIALSGQFASWAGRLVGLDRRIILVSEDYDAMLEAFTRLARVGMEHVIGYLEGGMPAWFRDGLPVEQVPQVTVQDLYREIDHIQLIDVRQPGEWEQVHIAQAFLKPLPKLDTMLDGLDRERPVAVHCKSGYRSSIASSLLKRAGFSQVMNMIGGLDAWKACDLPLAP